MNLFRNSLRRLWAALALPLGVAGAHAQLTEWPATVAPGRFLLEVDAISLTLDREGSDKYTVFGAATTFLTAGVVENLDIQVGAELFISQKFESAGLRERDTGVGDVYVRTKWRFFNDPDSASAAAVIPFVKIPTNSDGVGNDAVEGGVIVPWEAKLAGGVRLLAMAQLDLRRNDADDGFDTRWFASMALSRPFTRSLGVYGELAGGKSSGGGGFSGSMGAGATLAVFENAWWDFAVYRGLSRAAADWNPVVRFNFAF